MAFANQSGQSEARLHWRNLAEAGGALPNLTMTIQLSSLK